MIGSAPQSERWRDCTAIFDAVVECPAHERAALLEQHCQGDEALRRKVELLLEYDGKPLDCIESPAFEFAPELLLDDADALIGQHLGHYRIESVLGVGGMGVVYLAHDEQLGRKVGLKLLPQSLVTNQFQLERLQREARTASALNHPNIVTIHEIGEVEGAHYIATEFIEGSTLRARMERGPISIPEAVEIARQIASALSVAHLAGIVHRDIKPENIMLRPDGFVKILDFGIASVTPPGTTAAPVVQPGLILGTTRYMSPEQVRGQAVDARSDIWSLGVVLYEMLAGHPPFQGRTTTDVMAAVLQGEPPPLQQIETAAVPPKLQGLVEKALRKEPDQRFQTADEMLFQLRAPYETPKSDTKRLVLASVALALIAASIGYLLYSRTPEISSVAVLPFENKSEDPGVEYLADGITESLINNLATLPRMRVMARSTAFAYKGKNIEPQKVGRELKVDAIITGRIVRREDLLGLQAELVKTSDASQLWGAQYERKPGELPALQSQILRDVSEKLRARLSGEEQQRVTKQHTADAEAYRHFLKGLFHQEKRTQNDLQESVAYFDRAIERDPTYALAYAGLAESYRLFANYDVAPPTVACPKAKAAALKALELDASLAEAHTTLGMVFLNYDWDLPAAKKGFQRALQLNPNDSKAWHRYGNGYLLAARRFEEAIAAMQRAQELDPLSPIITTNLGETYTAAGKVDQGVDQLRKTILMYPTFANAHFDLGRAYLRRGDFALALAQFQTGKNLAPGEAGLSVMVGVAHAFDGNQAAARAVLHEVKELSRQRYFPPYYVAMIHAGLGQKDEAFTLLQRACDDRAAEMLFLDQEPSFESLRSDARFEQLLGRVQAGALPSQ